MERSRPTILSATNARIARMYVDDGRDAVRLALLMTGDRAHSEDIVQEAYVRLLSRWRLRSAESSRAYLMKTVINLSKNHRRRKGIEARYRASEVKITDTPGWGHDVEDSDEILRHLQDLTHRQRTVVVLRICEDLSERQVADLLEISEKAVRSRLARGLAKLRGLTEGEHR
jgi:RNA polymerase sigma factor (sigma-70 family)